MNNLEYSLSKGKCVPQIIKIFERDMQSHKWEIMIKDKGITNTGTIKQ